VTTRFWQVGAPTSVGLRSSQGTARIRSSKSRVGAVVADAGQAGQAGEATGAAEGPAPVQATPALAEMPHLLDSRPEWLLA
jgi:hypothetical protein